VPTKLGTRLLFSPSNTGPLRIENQVVTIHDMAAFDCADTFSRSFAAWYHYLLPRIAKRARHVITVSDFIKERIIRHTGVNESKISVIPNGVGSCFSPEGIASRDGALSSLQIPSRKYVLAVGSLERRKNLSRLLDAWARIQGRVAKDLWL